MHMYTCKHKLMDTPIKAHIHIHKCVPTCRFDIMTV